jgi:hypothetical protein
LAASAVGLLPLVDFIAELELEVVMTEWPGTVIEAFLLWLLVAIVLGVAVLVLRRLGRDAGNKG